MLQSRVVWVTSNAIAMPKRSRTTAPGSRQSTKKPRGPKKTNQIGGLLRDFATEPTLRHTSLSKTSKGRRKHNVSLVPLSTKDDTSDLLDENGELEMFQHFLDDDADWVPDNTETGDPMKGVSGKEKKKKKASHSLRCKPRCGASLSLLSDSAPSKLS